MNELTNRCRIDENKLYRMYRRVRWYVPVLYFLWVFVLFTMGLKFSSENRGTGWIGFLLVDGVLFIVSAVIDPIQSARKGIRRLVEVRHTESYEQTVIFCDDGIHVSGFSEAENVFYYDTILRILRAKNLILLMTLEKTVIILNPSRFENGTEADFWHFMNEKCPNVAPMKMQEM